MRGSSRVVLVRQRVRGGPGASRGSALGHPWTTHWAASWAAWASRHSVSRRLAAAGLVPELRAQPQQRQAAVHQAISQDRQVVRFREQATNWAAADTMT